ncbi:hypothetical protein ANCDUO_17459 [Ancylostoma duodenale]|uniref:Uncharacterized protein n=1 Tax=Ancylostoma duodenale TaxID=51022 RepID=A0A0C2FV64_9BILA|nr:hypothetical protein ANCDUO_17459 [Ancylostoma duodenale]
MGFVPRDPGTSSDSSLFLQERSENFRIYYSAETIGQQACTTGLYALVADGVHSPQPRELGRGSQLYCIRGVVGRASHMAQAWNRRLDRLGLAKYITDLDLEAKCALHRLERIPHEGKELRKRDALSRQWIDEEMASFECLYRLRRVQDHHV